MSSEVNVLFDGPLPSAAALTRAMKELGFPLAIKRGAGTLEQHKGFLPIRLRRQDSGVEFDTFNERSAIEEIAGVDIDARFTRSANFRWGGDDDEMLAGLCAAAALAKLVNGIVLNESDKAPLSAEEAIAQARKTLQTTADQQARNRTIPGTRPADIKRYLAPLLRERSDLVLIGRRLVIRPVRHLLRGALLDRTRHRYTLQVFQFIDPLFFNTPHPEVSGFFGVKAGWFQVWEPHFQPLLIASLAQDVFEPVGKITSLGQLGAQIDKHPHPIALCAQVTSLVLAGEHDRAAEFVRRVERDSVRAHWERVSRDVEALCAECHAAEAALIKAMKLESIWEPSPFPVELPPAQGARSDEPAFSTTPWISEPPDLFAEMPRHPGEFSFAKSSCQRKDVGMLLVPLTREAAEDRHNHLEGYVLAARLANGFLFTLDRSTNWDRHHPQEDAYLPDARFVSLYITLRGTTQLASVHASAHEEDPGRIEISSIDVYQRNSSWSIWQCHIDRRENKWTVHDDRIRPRSYQKFDLSDEIRTLATVPMPQFGEYAELVACVQALLERLGYGEVS